MPDSLDIAHQRKLIETLEREGQSTHEAEIRLRTMLDFLCSIRGYPTGTGDAQVEQRARGRA